MESTLDHSRLRAPVMASPADALRRCDAMIVVTTLLLSRDAGETGADVRLPGGALLSHVRGRQPAIRVYRGTTVLNGVHPGARVLIVDDTLSTGGTLIALIEAIRQRGGDTVGAIAVVEKVDAGGRARVLKSTGVNVRTLLQIRVSPGGVTVL